MALLKWAKDNYNIDFYEYRDHIFYHKFKYRLRIYKLKYLKYMHFKELNNFWSANVNAIELKGIKNNSKEYKTILKFIFKIKNDEKYSDHSIRTEYETLSIFGNDLDLLKNLSSQISHKSDISEAVAGSEPETKYFVKQPRHKYRVYFKEMTVPEDFAISLKTTLNNDKLSPSNALLDWVGITDPKFKYRQRYCRQSFYIDYSDESMLSYLLLLHGNIIGKKYKLEKRQITI